MAAAPKSGWAPVVIDRDAGRPALVGSRWQRREPAGDVWDVIVISGVFDNGPDHGGMELVVQPLTFGEPCLTADPESFASVYRRQSGDDVGERVAATLAALEASVA